ncbi:MAG TPA: hypothetical protein VHC43_15050 [Mycobacteriales bacterium]|nr:hypothetical protein [Mycobacteriales bacterium]
MSSQGVISTLVVAVLAASITAGCGGGTSTPQSHPQTVATVDPGDSTPSTTSASAADGLVVCIDQASQPGDEARTGDLELLAGGPDDLTESELSVVANGCPGFDDVYNFSPDLTDEASTQSTSDGSTVAGYLSTADGSFTDLSGHSDGGFTDQPVSDSGPIFNPETGDLWWNRGQHMWSATLPDGTAEDMGSGYVGGFTPAGDPLATAILTSPDGKVAATYSEPVDTVESGDSAQVLVGATSAFTSACTDRAYSVVKDYEQGLTEDNVFGQLAASCSGLASLTVKNCFTFNGFVNDSSFVCFDGVHYQLDSFSVHGRHATVTGAIQLTPNTNLTINGGVVDPSGSDLWFADSSGSVYVVSATTPTSDPTPTSVSVGENSAGGTGQFWTDGLVVGWRSPGAMQPAAYMLSSEL